MSDHSTSIALSLYFCTLQYSTRYEVLIYILGSDFAVERCVKHVAPLDESSCRSIFDYLDALHVRYVCMCGGGIIHTM